MFNIFLFLYKYCIFILLIIIFYVASIVRFSKYLNHEPIHVSFCGTPVYKLLSYKIKMKILLYIILNVFGKHYFNVQYY